MALVNKPIPSFWNGMSQQAAALRREGSAADQLNALGTIVEGLQKRPGTELVAVLDATASVTGIGCNAIIHEVKDVGAFIFIATNDGTNPFEIFNIATGARVTVGYDGTAKTYANTNRTTVNASQRIKMLSVNNVVWVLNTTVQAAVGGTAPGSLTGTVQTFDKLPTTPGAGNIYKIQGNDASGFSSYYVYWNGSTWEETGNPTISPDTPTVGSMPARFSYNSGTGQFELNTVTYLGRVAGDATTNPVPSFNGQYISDIFFYRGRLGLLARNNIILSQIGNQRNFYSTSVVDVRDDDPIDLAISLDGVDNLRFAVPFDKTLVVFGERNQFAVGSGESTLLTTRTIAATPTTRFEIEPNSAPFSVGPNVYFMTRGNTWLNVREYFVSAGSLIQDAADVTSHVPYLIPTGACQVSGNNAEDILFVRSEGDADTLFVYKYFWVKDDKAQSSWSKWTFSGDIAAMVSYQKKLYLVMNDGVQLTLESLNLEFPGRGGAGMHLHMDRWALSSSKTYDGSTYTTVAFPYAVEIATDTNFLIWNSTDQILYDVTDMVDAASGDVKLPGDLTSKTLRGGFGFDMEYVLSELFFTNPDTGAPLLAAKLGLRSLRLEYESTGYFTVEVESVGRDTREEAAADLSSNLDALGAWSTLNVSSGEAKFDIFLDSKEARVTIKNETILPCKIVAGSYDVFFTERARLV